MTPAASCKLVVLDLAGTTVEDSNHVASAFSAALADQGIRVSASDLSRVRGASKYEAIARFIPAGRRRDHRAAVAYAAFRRYLEDAYRAHGVRPVGGTEALLRFLRSRAVRVVINTGFDRHLTELLVGALGWRPELVDAVVCGEDVTIGRPAPFLIFRAMEAAKVVSVREVMTVGDTTLDLWAGHNAGVQWNVGVLTGAHPRDTLLQAPHTHLLRSVGDLSALWSAAGSFT